MSPAHARERMSYFIGVQIHTYDSSASASSVSSSRLEYTLARLHHDFCHILQCTFAGTHRRSTSHTTNHIATRSVGKRFSGSKRKVAWKFTFTEDRNRVHEVILKHSIISGKREILFDGQNVNMSRKVNMKVEFDFPFNCPGHLLRVSIKEMVDRFVYSLFIDNVPFRHLPHNSEAPKLPRATSQRKSNAGNGKSKSGGWDPFTEAAAGTPSSGKKKGKKKKSSSVKKQKSTSDWVSFDSGNSGETATDKKITNNVSSGADEDDLLSSVFSSAPAPATTTATPTMGSGMDDVFASATGGSSASLGDLSALYSSPINTNAPVGVTSHSSMTSPVRKQNAWGGLVDLNNIASPVVPGTSTSFTSGIGSQTNKMATARPGMTTNTAPMYASPARMPGGDAPGMRPPRGFNYHNTKPSYNPHAASQYRKEAATHSPASAFEADPFARFN